VDWGRGKAARGRKRLECVEGKEQGREGTGGRERRRRRHIGVHSVTPMNISKNRPELAA